MPGVTRKAADSAAPVEETEAAAEATSAGQAPAEPAAAPVEEFRPPVTVIFTGQAESSVARVGLCVPDEEYPVPADLADELCAGDSPLFKRAAPA